MVLVRVRPGGHVYPRPPTPPSVVTSWRVCPCVYFTSSRRIEPFAFQTTGSRPLLIATPVYWQGSSLAEPSSFHSSR